QQLSNNSHFNVNSPNPLVTSQNITVRIVGKTTVVIEKADFCKLFVEPSGSMCPVEKGNLDFTATLLIEQDPSEPNNIITSLYTKSTISNPDEQILLCNERMLKVFHP
ncbi:17195_t:CDS:2, partial [Funneliformis geosporum]